MVQGRPKVERQRLAETAAQSACRRAQSAIAEGAFAVAVRCTDEALAHVADHPSRASHVHHWVDGAHLLASPVDRKSPVDAHVGVIATGRPGAHLLLQLFERADAT